MHIELPKTFIIAAVPLGSVAVKYLRQQDCHVLNITKEQFPHLQLVKANCPKA